MRAVRAVGSGLLWVIAVIGVVSVLIWGATALGYVQPLVVISGSMEPKIMTGDLLFDTPHPTSELKVGDVVAIKSEVTGNLISHRVVKVVATGGHYEVNLKGDANHSEDGETYIVGDSVLRPVLQVPRGGYVVTKLTERSVVIPLGITLLALLGLSFAVGEPAPSRGRARRDPTSTTEAEVASTGPTEGDATSSTTPAVDETVRFPDRIADLSGAHLSGAHGS
ncbi:signal peptidase I [Cellulomonas sp. McL0617]|uniref:signal peptidase I n=1 Tax=Cellulomonas sp. McL0617 TaxID=3415675 RepID=UPI003CEEBB96